MATREDTAAERLNKHSIPEPNSGCLLWTAYTNRWGYGVINVGTRTWLAHRRAYHEFVGPIGGKLVLHKCDTPACIEPRHLFLGTDLDNARDRDAKGRHMTANSLKTHCKYGHSFYIHGFINTVGVRQCRLCARQRSRDAYHKKKN